MSERETNAPDKMKNNTEDKNKSEKKGKKKTKAREAPMMGPEELELVAALLNLDLRSNDKGEVTLGGKPDGNPEDEPDRNGNENGNGGMPEADGAAA